MTSSSSSTPAANSSAASPANEEESQEEYEVFVMKQDFKFHCAHFVAFKGYRERLHGHNYTVGVRMRGAGRGHDGYLIDFGDIKRVTRSLCKELNERFICPTRSDVIQIESDETSTSLLCEDGARFVFPTGDCAMLPVVHSTAEELAQYLWHRLTTTFSLEGLLARGIHTLQIIVAEAPRQEGSYTRKLTSPPPLCFEEDKERGRVSRPRPCIHAVEEDGKDIDGEDLDM
ncbi:6-pyruvoyl tetrahydropterin synthase [Nannochloropsis oceanica]